MSRLTLIIFTVALCSCDFRSPKNYLTEAAELEKQNKLKEAIILLDKAIYKDENYIPAYINRAVDKAILGNYQSAIQDYNIVLAKDSKNTLAFLNRGKNKHRLNDYLGAIEDFNMAISSKGGEAARIEIESEYSCSMVELKLERAVSYYFAKNLNNSFKDIQFCIQRNFERAIALYWRGMIYISTDKQELGCKDLQESSILGNSDAAHEISKYCIGTTNR